MHQRKGAGLCLLGEPALVPGGALQLHIDVTVVKHHCQQARLSHEVLL